MPKIVVNLFGVILIVIGLLGFYNDPVLGYFDTNAEHNWVHIVSGILALIFANSWSTGARTFGIIFGIAYGLIAAWGFMIGSGSIMGIAIDQADNWLHLILALVFLIAGFSGTPAPVPAKAKG